MRNLLLRLFGRRNETAFVGPVSGLAICDYLFRARKENEERLRDEIDNRGLSFGQIRVKRSWGFSNEFEILFAEKQPLVNRDSFKEVLRGVFEFLDWAHQIIIRDGFGSDEIECVFTPDAEEASEGVWSSGFRGGESFREKNFLSVRANERGLTFETYGVKAIDVMLAIAGRWSIPVEPVNYSYESDVPLGEIIHSSVRWYDHDRNRYYTEVKYDRRHERHLVLIGASNNRTYEEDGTEDYWFSEEKRDNSTIVFSADSPESHIRLNNQKVPTKVIWEPTDRMLALRDSVIREADKRYRCSCGKRATREIVSVRFEVGGDLGGFSQGGISYVCDDVVCEDKVKATSAIRHEVHPISDMALAEAS